MSFNYDKLKKKHESGEQWASYSDLFMVLSVVFLLLYVVASLRTGTHTLSQQIQKRDMANKVQDLEQQIKVYNTLKEDYLEKQAQEKEQKVYENLMSKLELLQEKNGREAEELRRKANENEKKKEALNQYQQIVRNIINANVLAKARIKRRDSVITTQKDTIVKKDETIKDNVRTIALKDRTIASKEKEIQEREAQISELDQEVEEKRNIIAKKNQVIEEKQRILAEKQNQIKNLNKDIQTKRKIISRNENKIKKIDSKLKRQITQLLKEKKRRKMSTKKYKQRLAKLRSASEKQKRILERKSREAEKQLKSVKAKVAQASKQLENANKTIQEQSAQKSKLAKELQGVQSKIAYTKQELENANKTIEQQSAEKERLAKELEKQEALKKQLAQDLATQAELKEKLSKDLKTQSAQKEKLSRDLASVQKRIAKKTKEYEKTVKNLNQKVSEVSSDLAKAKEKLMARKKLAKQIQKNFGKAGVKASVDGKTGDVILAFGQNYFDTGKANLKGGMQKTLNKFVPIYAKSLFQDPNIAKKIKSVDVIGFASPTYRGKYVNPNSLDPKDKKAIEYNLDLSYRRARSIFDHMFDTRKLKFEDQKKLLPLVKVSAKSFFSGNKDGRMPASNMSRREFCKKYDCKKEQRVIIKFDLNE